MIDMAADDEAQRQAVHGQHSSPIKLLVQHPDMKELVSCFKVIKDHEDHVVQLVTKTLKSRDILYPCRFCRHLFGNR